MPNGRCRMHGGASTGAPIGNTNRITHGIYSTALRADELELWEHIPLGGLDDELRLLRLQLRRVLEAQRKAEDEPENLTLLELTATKREIRAGDTQGGEKATRSNSVERTRPNYRNLILRLTGRIAELEDRRRVLLAGGEKVFEHVSFIIEG